MQTILSAPAIKITVAVYAKKRKTVQLQKIYKNKTYSRE